MQEEEKGKHTTKGINMCCAPSFRIFIFPSDFQALQNPSSRDLRDKDLFIGVRLKNLNCLISLGGHN